MAGKAGPPHARRVCRAGLVLIGCWAGPLPGTHPGAGTSFWRLLVRPPDPAPMRKPSGRERKALTLPQNRSHANSRRHRLRRVRNQTSVPRVAGVLPPSPKVFNYTPLKVTTAVDPGCPSRWPGTGGSQPGRVCGQNTPAEETVRFPDMGVMSTARIISGSSPQMPLHHHQVQIPKDPAQRGKVTCLKSHSRGRDLSSGLLTSRPGILPILHPTPK